MHRENSAQKIDMRREGGNVRVICEIRGLQSTPFVGFAEWLNIEGIIAILRSAVGPDWCPAEITFVSRGRPSEATLDAYGNARILTGQRCCSVLVAAADIAFAAGYEDAPHFSRAFKRLTGMTPRAYRCGLA